jgi:CBS domain-containing protein
MVVDHCMKLEVVTVSSTATIAEAVSLFNDHHVGMLPVLNGEGRLVGILNLRDLLDLIMPAFVNLIDDFDYVGDFGVLESKQPSKELLNQPVTAIMESPVSVPASSGLLRAFAYLHKYELLDLPIVDDQDRLVGLVSRVDVGRALLAGWRLNTKGDRL